MSKDFCLGCGEYREVQAYRDLDGFLILCDECAIDDGFDPLRGQVVAV